ncbi:Restriction endonuclease [Paucilactobacillus wasatchensis]|uniref:Restriction endonuclease n=1 Tax=Paucilactobacillus wasatchensis TaxID=1335616 RepID=A0A0D1A7P9_9LACO|nr:Restriction endonuclease [Paucilactobacillus wasatchensis]
MEVQPVSKADIDNLAVICRKCHHKKTEWERQYYGTGDGNVLTNAKPVNDITQISMLMNS